MMSVPLRHALKQGPMIKTILRSGMLALRYRLRGKRPQAKPPAPPFPVLTQILPPRAKDLVEDFVRHVGGDPELYPGVLPPHFFPQWGFPLLARTLDGLPYDLSRVLNVGTRMEIHHSLPLLEPLVVKAQLEEVDDNGARVILKQKLTTSTSLSSEPALTCHVFALIPLKREGGGEKKERPTVPAGSVSIDCWDLPRCSGFEFAVVTGDFNPVHWLCPYARLMGFKNVILHGFSQMARVVESLNKTRYAGKTNWLGQIEVRFVNPLALPQRVKVFTAGPGEFLVGSEIGGLVYLSGTTSERVV